MRTPLRSTFRSGLLLAVLATAGCAVIESPVPHEDVVINPAMPDVLIYDEVIAHQLALREARLETRSGVTTAHVKLRNQASDVLSLEYKVVWLDQHDLELGASRQGWSSLQIAPSGAASIDVMAPDGTARHYVLHVRTENLRPQTASAF